MDTDSCLDAYVDWKNSTHYDARVVRVCRPGGTVETDPGGDGYWVEHEDWDDEPVPGMKIAAGYRIVDNLSVAVSTILFRVDTAPVHDPAPGTASSWWARTRTLYQDGHIESYSHEPYDCDIEKVYPWNCQGA